MTGQMEGASLERLLDSFSRARQSTVCPLERAPSQNDHLSYQARIVLSTSQRAWNRCAFARERVQSAARRGVETPLFSDFFLGCIILNTLLLTLEHDGMSASLKSFLSIANVILTGLFTVELIAKLIGLGWRRYCADRFNVFDAVIVVFAFIELAFQLIGGNNE